MAKAPRTCSECTKQAVAMCGGLPKCKEHTRAHLNRVRQSALAEVRAELAKKQPMRPRQFPATKAEVRKGGKR